MSRNYHDVWRGKKVLQHGSTNVIGPLSSNPRHPRKLKPVPLTEPTTTPNLDTGGSEAQKNA